MAKRQTRRSISVKGITYARVLAYCKSTDRQPGEMHTRDGMRAVSAFIEALIAEKLDGLEIDAEPYRPTICVTTRDDVRCG